MEWNDLLSLVIQLVLTAALPTLTGVLVKWLLVRIEVAKTEMKSAYPKEYLIAERIYSDAVYAAEQLGLSGQIDKKLDWAMDYAEKELAKNGIVLDLESIRAGIEAAVYQQLNQYKKE